MAQPQHLPSTVAHTFRVSSSGTVLPASSILEHATSQVTHPIPPFQPSSTRDRSQNLPSMAAHTFCLSSSGAVLPASMASGSTILQDAYTITLRPPPAVDHSQYLPSMVAHTFSLSSSGAVLSASLAPERAISEISAKTVSNPLKCDPLSAILNSTAALDPSSTTSTPISELSDGQLPPPYTTGTPESSIYDSDTAQFGAIRFQKIPDTKLFLNALENPAARCTTNLYVIANNTQYAMQAWQEEYDALGHEIKKREINPRSLPVECECKKTCGHKLGCKCRIVCKCKGYIVPKLPSSSIIRKGGRSRGDNTKAIAKALDAADAKINGKTPSFTPSVLTVSPESGSGRSQRVRKETAKMAEKGATESVVDATSTKSATKRKVELDEANGESEKRGKKRLATLVPKTKEEASGDDVKITRSAPPKQEAARTRKVDVASLLNAEDVAPKTVLGKRLRETTKDLAPKTEEYHCKRRRSLTKASIAAIIDHDDDTVKDRVIAEDAMPTVEGRRTQRRRAPPKTPTWLHEEVDDGPAPMMRTRSHSSHIATKPGSETPLATIAPIAPLHDASLRAKELKKEKPLLFGTVDVGTLTSQPVTATKTHKKKADTTDQILKPSMQKMAAASSETRAVDPEKSAKMQQVWARRKLEGKSGRYGTAPLNKEAGETLKTKHPERIADFQARKAAGMVGTRKRKSTTKTEDEDDEDDDNEATGNGMSKKARTSR